MDDRPLCARQFDSFPEHQHYLAQVFAPPSDKYSLWIKLGPDSIYCFVDWTGKVYEHPTGGSVETEWGDWNEDERLMPLSVEQAGTMMLAARHLADPGKWKRWAEQRWKELEATCAS